MAALSITIANHIGLFAMEPTSKWGTLNWGNENWGTVVAGFPILVDKLIANSEALTTNLQFEFIKLITNSEPVTSTILIEYEKFYTDTFDLAGDLSSESLKDGSGYNYVFVKPTTEAENRDMSEYTQIADPGSSWTSLSAGSTIWS